LSQGCLKAKESSWQKNKSRYISKTQIKVNVQGMFLKSLPWLVKRNLCLKIIFFIAYLFIFLSQYCVPKCLVWIRPKNNVDYKRSKLFEGFCESLNLSFVKLCSVIAIVVAVLLLLLRFLNKRYRSNNFSKIGKKLIPFTYLTERQQWFSSLRPRSVSQSQGPIL